MTRAQVAIGLAALLACSRADRRAREPGLLFYLSGTRGTEVDFSMAGTERPNVERGVSRVDDGARGPGLRCANTGVLAYRAPGNIYAQRGTLSFFWRARDPVGPTEFPIFRVSYGDHSSWDMVWARIDYNGHGFDAFVTDADLARTRVSVAVAPFPPPDAWIHLALAWDETSGIRFFVDGKLVAEKAARALLDAALDQFGPHARIISPHNVQSDYSFVRGGDIDELRIYDRMLDESQVARLARGRAVSLPPLAARSLDDRRWRDEWWWRNGWNRPGDPPPYVAGPSIAARKVEIHDARDLGRWWWKANDGIRETTWPGVYNRSRLPGRSDYFTLLDWDCYTLSGRSVTFTLPDEPWNYLAIDGAAYGRVTLVGGDAGERPLFERPAGQERTVHLLPAPIVGQRIRFDNVEPEQPIGELAAYLVTPGAPPQGRRLLRYRLVAPKTMPADLAPLVDYLRKRHPPDERATLLALPVDGASQPLSSDESHAPSPRALPVVHVLVPRTPAGAPDADWDHIDDGLDGIVLDIPALRVAPTHGAYFPLRIRVADPLWPARALADLSFSVKPDEAKTLWLDLRDRLLPPGKSLLVTVAGAGGDFGAASLAGAELRLVWKPRADARAEHELDRFTQARDAYAMMVEERPADARFDLWNRFKGDVDDLLRVAPDHALGRVYAAAAGLPGAKPPPFAQPVPPPGVPLWAFRQVTALAGVERLVLWYIDHRQIANGELGGGLSDDTDLANMWPGVALMGCAPDKLEASLRRVLDACYAHGMLVRGLPAAQADELHGYEEGINALGQSLLLGYGSPTLLERAMETTRAVAGLTGVNGAGHRHFRTAYYSATRVAEDGPWGYAKPYMTLLLHPTLLLAEWNGNPSARRLVVDLASGLIAHRHADGSGPATIPRAIHFATDRESADSRDYLPWPLYWASYRWTGDRKYLQPIFDGGVSSLLAVGPDLLDELDARADWKARILGVAGDEAASTEARAPGDVRGPHSGNAYRRSSNEHFAWQLTGDKSHLEKLYAEAIADIARHEYINTEGSIWIDRVVVPYADLQRARLGGVALVRNGTYPGHVVGWRFEPPATAESVAVLVPRATPRAFDVVAYNLEQVPVQATMTTWNIEPGRWRMVRGVDSDGDDQPDRAITRSTLALERGAAVPLVLPPRTTTVLRFALESPGVAYAARPDLGIAREDVKVEGRVLRVRVHSLGGVAAPPARLVFRDAAGRARAEGAVPALLPPLNLLPKTADVELALPPGVEPAGGTVEVELDAAAKVPEITRLNNVVKL